MKLLHTADWHLGHQIQGHERRFEHDAFLDWLADTIKRRDIDALLVAGKGHETYQQIKDTKHPFSDQDILREFMA